MLLTIPKVKFSEPRRNLPSWTGRATQEDRFVIAFARAYVQQMRTLYHDAPEHRFAVAREIPVNGYGIADLVAVSSLECASVKAKVSSTKGGRALRLLDNDAGKIKIRAFECKMRDWRSALRQAARYRFFAHQAIVVLPIQAAACALPFLETFRKIHVGLWSFDQETETIHQKFTPRLEAVKAPHYIPRVIQAVCKATKSIPPISRIG